MHFRNLRQHGRLVGIIWRGGGKHAHWNCREGGAGNSALHKITPADLTLLIVGHSLLS
jgi:hypothetical protein